MNNSQLCKLFIGGLNVQTTEAGLRDYFERYGELTDCVVVVNPHTKRSRCFGFVTYSTAEEADGAVAAAPHVLDGNSVELKRAVSREDSARPGAHAKVKKLFVGGLKGDVKEEDLVEYFSRFGALEKVEIIADKLSGKKRGFGFICFEEHDSADKAAVVKFHSINGHRVEVKKAVPKQDMQGPPRWAPRGGSGGGGGGPGGRGLRNQNGFGGGSGGYGRDAGNSSYGGFNPGGPYYNSGYGDYGDDLQERGGYGYGNGYNNFGSYDQHQSSFGPMKGGGYSGRNNSGPYRGGYGSNIY
ncbi:heterogeneous nuclear ribonucleoprotein A0-like [Latimeria chalumnae]|nr:PREDICTED: heterogeneous nuclear ribonucleoprotein A0-like [Latimeria chalumnae]|eukprot:XP_005995111.1 PREDICTED: heterogeneous nuclear ribonucleoprotein A0-like [Latimeria chalumnae]